MNLFGIVLLLVGIFPIIIGLNSMGVHIIPLDMVSAFGITYSSDNPEYVKGAFLILIGMGIEFFGINFMK